MCPPLTLFLKFHVFISLWTYCRRCRWLFRMRGCSFSGMCPHANLAHPQSYQSFLIRFRFRRTLSTGLLHFLLYRRERLRLLLRLSNLLVLWMLLLVFGAFCQTGRLGITRAEVNALLRAANSEPKP